ncbi:CPBP family intramembrane glutamic endopeptidase [Acetobacterium bakii]|uniref:CAAX prenyl protease 2/Lysostaphin resistance protein A-like domain-containing protein n=1 Tax=Acetobacterium bakii TaxID=52689 RepID=A0A0L6U395_9FIRM|nr:CPBP family intramembrane glutamic endopeptidase [Acetobacterium bakii]KNZ42260.1 hypothetical protein AKG39_07720 [Acetobacterium bakii]
MDEILKRRIEIFILVVIGCGWFGKVVDNLLSNQPDQSLGSLVWLISPFIVSLILAWRSPVKNIGFRPNFSGNGKWYLLSLVLFPLFAAISIGLEMSLGIISVTSFKDSLILQTLAGWFVFNFFRSILEETAWRGFLQERLIKINAKGWTIYSITAIVWWLWHIPYYLFFYDGVAMDMIVSSFFVLASFNVLFMELYAITRTIWPCVLLHATTNAIQYTVVENPWLIDQYWGFWFSPSLSVMICLFCVIIGIAIRKVRIEKLQKNHVLE